MSTPLDPIQVAEELRWSLSDSADPPLNYIHALERLIAVARLAERTADVAQLLQPFESQYPETPNPN